MPCSKSNRSFVCIEGRCEQPPLPQEICNDGFDNDYDGLTDCFDSDCPCPNGTACGGDFKCIETQCDDGTDNNENGKIDCKDDSCDGQPCLVWSERGSTRGFCQKYECVTCDECFDAACRGEPCLGKEGWSGICLEKDLCVSCNDCKEAACEGLPCGNDGGRCKERMCTKSSTCDSCGKGCDGAPCGKKGICKGNTCIER